MRGYRKLAVSLLGLGLGAVLAYHGKLDAPAAGLIGSIVAAYVGANVGRAAVGGGQ